MADYTLTVTEDEALVLFEFFSRNEETSKFELVHPAEWIALMKVSAQIDKTTSAMFRADYESLLADARARLAEGYEDDDFPGSGA